jgi:putative transposase
MGRKPRIFYNGALYHIIQRGNNKDYIYKDNSDKTMFFNLLLLAKEKCGFEVLYYVLMDNHYHMILESGDIPISKALQLLNTSYSKYFNKKYNRSGGIYEGRYASLLITSQRYYYQLLKYMAFNPVEAGIVKNAKDYKWGAHQHIRSGHSNIINICKTLSFFSGSEGNAFADYIDLIEHDAGNKSDYGLLPEKSEQSLCSSLDHILQTMGLTEEMISRLKRGDKTSELIDARRNFITQAFMHGYRIKEIANHISLSYESVRSYVKNNHIQKVL